MLANDAGGLSGAEIAAVLSSVGPKLSEHHRGEPTLGGSALTKLPDLCPTSTVTLYKGFPLPPGLGLVQTSNDTRRAILQAPPGLLSSPAQTT